jgi:hypothetical protein
MKAKFTVSEDLPMGDCVPQSGSPVGQALNSDQSLNRRNSSALEIFGEFVQLGVRQQMKSILSRALPNLD